MSKAAVVLLLTSGVALSVGCGGGGLPTSGSGFHTSVPGDKPLDTLSAADTKQLCTDALNFLTSPTGFASKEDVCRLAGVETASLAAGGATTDQELQAACQVGYAACESSDAGVSLSSADGGAPADQCASATPLPSTCTATVAQYTACVNEITAAVLNIAVPCSQVTKTTIAAVSADGGASTSPLEGGPACTAFTAACPDMTVTSMGSMPLTRAAR